MCYFYFTNCYEKGAYYWHIYAFYWYKSHGVIYI